MTRESNKARVDISVLLDRGETFKTIGFYIKCRTSTLKSFYECTGRDLEPTQCQRLCEMVKGSRRP